LKYYVAVLDSETFIPYLIKEIPAYLWTCYPTITPCEKIGDCKFPSEGISRPQYLRRKEVTDKQLTKILLQAEFYDEPAMGFEEDILVFCASKRKLTTIPRNWLSEVQLWDAFHYGSPPDESGCLGFRKLPSDSERVRWAKKSKEKRGSRLHRSHSL
jgi:hypothetical protein